MRFRPSYRFIVGETSNVYELPVPPKQTQEIERVTQLEAELAALRSVLAKRPTPNDEATSTTELRRELARAVKALTGARLDKEETQRVNDLLQRENARLKKYNRSLKARLEMSHNTALDLRRQISRLAKQLKSHTVSRQQLVAETRMAKTLIGELESRCGNYESRIATLRQQMEVLMRVRRRGKTAS